MPFTSSTVRSPIKMNVSAVAMIEDINARQDDALRQLEELNERIEALVELCAKTAKVEAGEADDQSITDIADAAAVDDQNAGVEVHSSDKRAA